MGHLLGHGVRFGAANDVMAAGEGIETMLSLRSTMPTLPMVAALSANHLAALLFPVTLRRLYIARDADPAGDIAMASLADRAQAAGSRHLPCHRGSTTSTWISAAWASTIFELLCARNSPRRTWSASCRERRPRRGEASSNIGHRIGRR